MANANANGIGDMHAANQQLMELTELETLGIPCARTARTDQVCFQVPLVRYR